MHNCIASFVTCFTVMGAYSKNKDCNTCQPGLGACGASLSSPGRLVLSDLIEAGSRHIVNVGQDHIVPQLFPRLANMAWTFDLSKQHALSHPVKRSMAASAQLWLPSDLMLIADYSPLNVCATVCAVATNRAVSCGKMMLWENDVVGRQHLPL